MKQPHEELLFGLALTKPAAERAAWLDRECAGDIRLRLRVRDEAVPAPGNYRSTTTLI